MYSLLFIGCILYDKVSISIFFLFSLQRKSWMIFPFDRRRKLRGYQNRILHLCLKVYKTRWKCHANCMCGILEGSVTTRIVWATEKLYNDRRFSTRQEPAEESLDIMLLWTLALCQMAKGWEIEEDLSYTRLTEMRKQRWLNLSR